MNAETRPLVNRKQTPLEHGTEPAVPEPVRTVIGALQDAGCNVSIGGSRLLAALDLSADAQDWDITTDGPTERVQQALASTGLTTTERATGDGPYATAARFSINNEDVEIDVLVDFALHRDDEVFVVPSAPTATWRGLPMASPEAWAEAYLLMGRKDRSALLAQWLRTRKATT